jgi:hypothetical protein
MSLFLPPYHAAQRARHRLSPHSATDIANIAARQVARRQAMMPAIRHVNGDAGRFSRSGSGRSGLRSSVTRYSSGAPSAVKSAFGSTGAWEGARRRFFHAAAARRVVWKKVDGTPPLIFRLPLLRAAAVASTRRRRSPSRSARPTPRRNVVVAARVPLPPDIVAATMPDATHVA